eukprot:5759119-Pyramimonas_sp.AAC.1
MLVNTGKAITINFGYFTGIIGCTLIPVLIVRITCQQIISKSSVIPCPKSFRPGNGRALAPRRAYATRLRGSSTADRWSRPSDRLPAGGWTVGSTL